MAFLVYNYCSLYGKFSCFWRNIISIEAMSLFVMEIIMRHIFNENESELKYAKLSAAIKQFKNSVTIELFEKNYILQNR